MTLISNLTQLKARLTSIPSQFGVTQYRDVVVRTAYLPTGSLNSISSDILITPKCRVGNVPPRLVGEHDGLTIYNNDLHVLVVRNFDFLSIKDKISYFIIDPIYDENEIIVGGIKASLVYLNDKKTLDWELILRQSRDKKSWHL